LAAVTEGRRRSFGRRSDPSRRLKTPRFVDGWPDDPARGDGWRFVKEPCLRHRGRPLIGM